MNQLKDGGEANGTAKWNRQRFTASELLALQSSDPALFKKRMEGKIVTLQGTVYCRPVHLGRGICIEVEGGQDFTHGAKNVMVIFVQTDERRFTPKFHNWAMSRLPGDEIAVSGTIRGADAKHDIPITIWDAKLIGF